MRAQFSSEGAEAHGIIPLPIVHRIPNWPECTEWIKVIELSKVVKQIRVIGKPIFTTEARRHRENL
ncbi:MAG TPA: hypothetical protein VFO40_19615 [Chthoniobacterales bacterium]|nr:hypothetical protein [Chthoniobacterales bacterium]